MRIRIMGFLGYRCHKADLQRSVFSYSRLLINYYVMKWENNKQRRINMGRIIYSSTVSHPAHITFSCEHCGEENSFSQDIVGTSSADVGMGAFNSTVERKTRNLGSQAQNALEGQLRRIEADTASGKYTWIKLTKCSKCGYHQSWQKSLINRKLLVSLLWTTPLLLFFIMGLTAKNADTGKLYFIIPIGLLLIPYFNYASRISKIDKQNQNLPDVDI